MLLYFGLNHLGLLGAAIAFSIRGLIDFVLLASLAGGAWKALRLFIFPVMLFTVSFLITFQTSIDNMHWLAYVIVHILITMTWAWWKAPDSIRISVLARLKTFFKKSASINSK